MLPAPRSQPHPPLQAFSAAAATPLAILTAASRPLGRPTVPPMPPFVPTPLPPTALVTFFFAGAADAVSLAASRAAASAKHASARAATAGRGSRVNFLGSVTTESHKSSRCVEPSAYWGLVESGRGWSREWGQCTVVNEFGEQGVKAVVAWKKKVEIGARGA